MCLEKIEGAKNPTDMLTKYVDVGKLAGNMQNLGWSSIVVATDDAVR